MTFKADLHIHTDSHNSHGERPENLAPAIIRAGLDVVAVTEHCIVSDNYHRLKEAIARELEKQKIGTRRELIVLLGCEMTLTLHGFSYHVGYIYKEAFDAESLPKVLAKGSNLEDLKKYKKDHPGICVLNHPTSKDQHRDSASVTARLMADRETFEAVELLNGTMISEIGKEATKRGIEIYNRINQNNKPTALGNSDAHRAHMIGTAYTTYNTNSAADIFTAILSGNTKPICTDFTF